MIILPKSWRTHLAYAVLLGAGALALAPAAAADHTQSSTDAALSASDARGHSWGRTTQQAPASGTPAGTPGPAAHGQPDKGPAYSTPTGGAGLTPRK